MKFKSFLHSMVQHYERVVAVVVMSILVSASCVLLLQVYNLKKNIKSGSEMPTGGAPAQKLKPDQLQQVISYFSKQPIWPHVEHRIFVAPWMKEDPKTRFPYRFNLKDLPPIGGIPLPWLEKYNLPFVDPVSAADPDGDGFSNLDEYLADTIPIDVKSCPDFAYKLKVKSIDQKPFPFIFMSVSGTSETDRKFGVQGSQYFYVKKGELIPDDLYPGFRVVEYREKTKVESDPTILGEDGKPRRFNVDVSELEIARDGQQPVVLIKSKKRMSDEIFAKLYFTIDKKEFSDVAIGNILELKGIPYKVKSIKKIDKDKPEVIVQREDSKQEFTLPTFTSDDAAALKANSSSSSEDKENKTAEPSSKSEAKK